MFPSAQNSPLVSIETEVKTPAPRQEIFHTDKITKYCDKLHRKFDELSWKEKTCLTTSWNHVRNSVEGDPLIWTVFGENTLKVDADPHTTLLLCGVHGDEITPIKFCFDAIEHLKNAWQENPERYAHSVVVVAPVVNPDSFFKRKVSRTNARGVDINRNFATRDWHTQALQIWKNRYQQDPRRFPGNTPQSEPEVTFQVNLIHRYRPDKIISVHAPLTMLDYDGPALGDVSGKKANQLLITMSEKAKGYRVQNYPYFPGSLGNYAGKERNIPTYTLELPSSDPAKSYKYWKQFLPSIESAITEDLRETEEEKKMAELKKKGDTSPPPN